MGIHIKVLKLLKDDGCRPYSIYLTNILLNNIYFFNLARYKFPVFMCILAVYPSKYPSK